MNKHSVSYSLLVIFGLVGCTHSANTPTTHCDEVTEIIVGDEISKVMTINCDTDSLADRIKKANSGDIVLVKGSCKEKRTIEITQDGVTLQGMGAKIIGEPGTNVISVNSRNATINHLDISGGLNGIVISPDSRVQLNHVFSHDNIGFGIVAGKSSVTSKDLAGVKETLKNIQKNSDTPSNSTPTTLSNTASQTAGMVQTCNMVSNNNPIGGVWVNNIIFNLSCSGNQFNHNGWIGLLSQTGRTNVLANAGVQLTGNGLANPAYGWGIALQSSSHLKTYAGSSTNNCGNVNGQNITVDSSSSVNGSLACP